MTHDSLTVRDLSEDDLDQALTVRNRSFGTLPDSEMEWWRSMQDDSIAQRRMVGVLDGDRLVGHGKARPFTQFWGGRPLPMAGIAGVVVSPEYRGRGVASMMLAALAERALELGDVVSALYPATLAPYRRAGWEIVAAQNRITMDTHLLRGLGPPEERVRAAAQDDAELIRKLVEDHLTRTRANGAKLLTESEITESITDPSGFAYLTDEGFVLYEWDEGDLFVTSLVAGSASSARTLWSVVGSGSSVSKRVHAYVAPDDPIHLLLPEEVAHDSRQVRWMLRVLDPERAVALRGFPPGVSGAALLTLDDPLLPATGGGWLLEVEQGRGSLTRQAAEGGVRLGPNGLAALFAGTPLGQLRLGGLAAGGSAEDDELLDTAFAGRPAYLLEYF